MDPRYYEFYVTYIDNSQFLVTITTRLTQFLSFKDENILINDRHDVQLIGKHRKVFLLSIDAYWNI